MTPPKRKTRTLNAEDARCALIDALADVAHVIKHEGVDGIMDPSDEVLAFALRVDVENALPGAIRHFRAEDGPDPIDCDPVTVVA